ncbi:MAG: zinc ribbon domain-containing protein [Candidatus Aegiribacteria sp.]
MKRVSIALKCPSCAGPLRIREGDTHTVCPNCSSSLILPSAVRKYVLPSAVSRVAALRTVRRQLEKVNPRGVENARVSRPVLYYVPFWHCSAQVNGYVLGVEPVYREREISVVDSEGQSGSGYAVTVTRKVRTRSGGTAVEREIQLSGSVNVSGADLEPLGIPSLSADSQLSIQGLEIQKNNLPEGLEILEDESSRDGIFVDPAVTLSQAREQTERYLRRLGSGVGFGLEEKWEFAVLSGHRDALVYYPLWVTDFRYGGGSYQVVVDGRSGEVLRGRFPSSGRDRRILTVAAALFWAAILPYNVELIFSGGLSYRNTSGGESSCLPVLLLILGGLAYATWRFLGILGGLAGREGDHVIY